MKGVGSMTLYRLVDTHAHLDQLEDVEGALGEARRLGLVAVVAVGTGYESNYRVLELAHKYPGTVYPALGLHPWEISRELPTLQESLGFIEDHLGLAVAVGEVGLDYDKRVRTLAGKDVQQAVLRDLLALAKRHEKPVSFHSRYAWKDSLALVQHSGVTRVVFHWFTGFSSVLAELVAEGYFISATPAAEYHQEHRRAVKEAPLSRLLLETDCPVDYGREVRYTSRVRDIVRSLGAVSEIKGLDMSVVAAETTRNALEFFGIERPHPFLDTFRARD
ncbi:MAG: TatD family hydrolase [Chloroflexota bacterium]